MFYDVVPDELRTHASHLDALIDRLSNVTSAANTVSVSDEAYGLLCSFLPPMVNPMEERGIEALRTAVEGVGNTAENVRATATQCQDGDEVNSQPFQRALTSDAKA